MSVPEKYTDQRIPSTSSLRTDLSSLSPAEEPFFGPSCGMFGPRAVDIELTFFSVTSDASDEWATSAGEKPKKRLYSFETS